jgi:hypothetical protein
LTPREKNTSPSRKQKTDPNALECPANFVPVKNIGNWHERSWRWHEARGIKRSR